ncbi:MAG TPA: cytochrome c oxidase assembly protein [Solirubrobacterales bacterium]|jgi:cytochrome c oxidase assembly factor CtaG|nr:cytochrome c oxidase assembly protein [Solirubrobacterales bacterium]
MILPPAHFEPEFAPIELLPLLIPALLYWWRATNLAQRGRPVPLWRQFSFAAGLMTIALSLIGLGELSDQLLWPHMLEHLLIGDLAAILLVLGLTGPLLQPILAIKPFDRLRVLAHPAVALPLWAIDLYVWHIPALYERTLSSPALHALEHAMFIFFGCLMWMPVLGPLPKPKWFGAGWKVIYVITVRFVSAVLGNVFIWSGAVFYPAYTSGDAAHNISPLTDQGVAGSIMMGEGMIVTLAVLAWAFLKWAADTTERQRLLDLAEARGIPLDEARAARAVAAGQAKHLEERLLAGEPQAPGAGPG